MSSKLNTITFHDIKPNVLIDLISRFDGFFSSNGPFLTVILDKNGLSCTTGHLSTRSIVKSYKLGINEFLVNPEDLELDEPIYLTLANVKKYSKILGYFKNSDSVSMDITYSKNKRISNDGEIENFKLSNGITFYNSKFKISLNCMNFEESVFFSSSHIDNVLKIQKKLIFNIVLTNSEIGEIIKFSKISDNNEDADKYFRVYTNSNGIFIGDKNAFEYKIGQPIENLKNISTEFRKISFDMIDEENSQFELYLLDSVGYYVMNIKSLESDTNIVISSNISED